MSHRRESWLPLPRRARNRPPEDGDGAAPEPARPTTAGLDDRQVSKIVGAKVVDCALYEEGRRVGGRIGIRSAIKAAEERDGFVWIGLHEPSAEELEWIAGHFGLHSLAIEDAIHAHQRPKLEVYGDSLFLVMKTARYVDHEELVQIGELVVFAGPRFVVTVRHGEGSALGGVRSELENHPELLALGPSAVLYAVADKVVDDYAEVIEGLDVDIAEIETEVFSASQGNPAERIYRLKREVLEFKRAVNPLGPPLQRLTAGAHGLPVDPRTSEYFRDVHDHLVRDAERIGSFDEILTGALQANLAQITLRDNQDMRRISAWVAILAVPTMVFGLYGMNFEHMPELEWQYGYPLVIGVTLCICATLYRTFRRAGWL